MAHRIQWSDSCDSFPMNKSTDPDPMQLGELIDEFTARVRAGQRPRVEDYASRHPQLADEIRELFPTLLTMEQAGVGANEASVTASGKAPKQLGEYRILREIGRGGMGVVYEAEQESLGRHVAIKVLPFHALMDPKHLTRFHREARAVAQLHHSNIVPVFGVGEHEGIHYYAMQFIRGLGLDLVLEEMRSLRGATDLASASKQVSAIQTRPVVSPIAQNQTHSGEAETGKDVSGSKALPAGETTSTPRSDRPLGVDTVDEAVSSGRLSGASVSSGSASGYHFYKNVARIGAQIAEALSCAHAQGILHRDIKPSNLLIDSCGQAWVTDFGLAKTLEGDLTHTGDLVGTLRYMAPERFRGWSDPRSDVYSLGLTLYEMLTLHPAFEDADRVEMIRRVMQENPPAPRQVDIHIPRDLETIVLKAIEKEPYARYQSALDLANDLLRFVADKPIVATRTPVFQHVGLWCRRNPVAAALSGIVLFLVLVLTASSMVYSVQVRRSLVRVKAAENAAQDANLRAQENLFDSYVAQARALRQTRRPGQRIDSLQAISQAAELMRTLEFENDWQFELRNEAIASMALVDLQPDRRWPGDQYGERSSHMSWAIDAKAERYARELAGGEVVVYDMHDDRELMRVSGESYLGDVRPYFEFSGDGRYLGQYFVAGDGRTSVQLFDLLAQRPVFEQVLPSVGEAYWRQIAFSPDSQHFLYQAPDHSLQVINLESLVIRQIPLKECLSYLSFSPDGKYIAVDVAYTTVLVVDTQTIEEKCRFLHPAEVTSVAWSNDGRMLAAACVDGNAYVWRTFDSSQPLAKCIGHADSIRNIAFNSSAMLLTTSWDQTTRLWNAPTGRELMQLDFFGGRRFSTDDQWLGFEYAGRDVGRLRMHLSRECRVLSGLNGGLKAVVQGLSFSPDSRLLASTSKNELSIWDTNDGTCLERNTNYERTTSVQFHHAKDELFVCGGDSLDCWKVLRSGTTGQFVQLTDRETIFTSHSHQCPAANISRNGVAFVSEVMTGKAHILNLLKPNERMEVYDDDWINHSDISPDGKWAACGSWKTAHWSAWDTQSGEEVVRRETRLDGAGVNFSPDGKWLVVREADEVNFVRVSDWKKQFTLRRDQPGFANVAISPDMKLLAISEMTHVKLYDFSSRQLLALLRGPNDVQLSSSHPSAAAICFSPDCKLLAIGTYQDIIQLWDLRLLRERLLQLGLDWD